jgi:heme a synthase
MLWTALRLGDRPIAALPARIRVSAVGLMILVLVQLYLGALVAGLRAGFIYNTWPLIDGAFVPDASRLFFNVPAWRNFFENTLTAQFDHRMMAYALWLLSAAHSADVLWNGRRGAALMGALALFIAITIQAALGIVTLLARTPLPLALLHQAMAMVVLTVAAAHAALVAARSSRGMVPAFAAAKTR